jgi:excisionase family DNA binding protein
MPLEFARGRTMATDANCRGYTPRELARLLRVNADRVRRWIENGELKALNLATVRCGRPRYVILPHHLEEFEKLRQAGPPPRPSRRRRPVAMTDFYPD